MTTQASVPTQPQTLTLKHKVRFVTAASLFDGHDAAINVMRRLIQEQGAEVIHLGHNRSALEVVNAAIQEDAQAIALSSYQGGHIEYFTYMHDLLKERGAGHIRIFGGGGGVIVPREIDQLQAYGIERIYSPEDGRTMGLIGMIQDCVSRADFSTHEGFSPSSDVSRDDWLSIARCITLIEESKEAGGPALPPALAATIKRGHELKGKIPVIGLTGTGGAGKSSLTDEVLLRLSTDFPDMRIAVLSVDPSKRRTGGALLGDRIRMNALSAGNIYMRSLASRATGVEVSPSLHDAIALCRAAGFDLVLAETSGIGQGSSAIVDLVDIPVYVMTSEYGAASQLEKIDMLDYAQLVALNKFERKGSEDALRDVKKQMWRNRGGRMDTSPNTMPVFPTIASVFNDPGVNAFYQSLLAKVGELSGKPLATTHFTRVPDPEQGPRRTTIIPGERLRYLSDIADSVRDYKQWARDQKQLASRIYACFICLQEFGDTPPCRLESYPAEALSDSQATPEVLRLRQRWNELLLDLDGRCRKLLAGYPELEKSLQDPQNVYVVRGREIRSENYLRTLSGSSVPKVALPAFSDWGDLLGWLLLEAPPGHFPYTSGVFPYKRVGEDPARMFAGEGPPDQTNKRFHLLAQGQPAARLSTAFDSVTLYGEDPHERPDIFGKVGDSGVSICTVEDAEILYSGFDLCAPNTSVSMTINGPAPTILAFYFNTAIRQQVRKRLMEDGTLKASKSGVENAWNDPRNFEMRWEDIRKLIGDVEYARIKADTLTTVRGTVQADILKEDQAQNTCIFSTEFSLKVMGDVQQSFIENDVRNFYSVSISGYHIAEAGANPITQLALTLANGFTYVEYYRSRGMDVNDFAPNLSFFFSNGMDAEYAVIGRVARRIWAVAMERLFGADERSQKLKYHIQTSGRSLHAMEIDFNDIRTTLQALLAINDNCNSLHTNAYDEAITTPTEESVRRALAIQLIINRELGLAKNENPLQGSFIIRELTELVEEAVLAEFDRLTERGGVLGAMETQYQRGKIQEESMYYEALKHNGELPIVGVNTFLNPKGSDTRVGDSIELRRATPEQKHDQIARLRDFQQRHAGTSGAALDRLQNVALSGGNIFDELMECVQHCSLGQISEALYDVGGRYRRNM